VISGAAKLDLTMAELDLPLASRGVGGTLIEPFNVLITDAANDGDGASLRGSSGHKIIVKVIPES